MVQNPIQPPDEDRNQGQISEFATTSIVGSQAKRDDLSDPGTTVAYQSGNLVEVDDKGGFQPKPIGRFGNYELLDVIGRGGMGIVYRARQGGTDRIVALKVIPTERLDGLSDIERHESLERFHREARAAARVQHDHVVQVYEVGVDTGRPFYAMRYVAGTSLAHVIAKGPLESRRAARYMLTAARGVEAAHRQGVLHRDLKPHNVLLESDVDRVLVADFGLAKILEGAATMTADGAAFGTPSYMAPEQVRNSATVDVRADVYGLGATLYHLLTGRPPFQSSNVAETMRLVLDTVPLNPRQLNPGIDHDLETICLKCLEKDPSRRYRSAAEFADDLERYLEFRPILARSIGVAGRATRWCRRNPVVTGLLTAVVLVSFIGTGVSLRFALQRNKAASDALHSAAQAVENEKLATAGEARALTAAQDAKERAFDARILQYVSDLNLASVAFRDRRWKAAEELLSRHSPAVDQTDLRGFEWHYLNRQLNLQDFELDSNGRALAFAGPDALLYCDDKRRLVCWNLTKAEATASMSLSEKPDAGAL